MSIKDTKKLLEIRKNIKSNKPVYIKQNGAKKIKVGSSYRKPRGFGSRMRIQRAGYPAMPTPGYRSPVLVRHKSTEGLNFVVVGNVAQLNNANPKLDTIVIGATVGAKKSIEIYKKAKEFKFVVHNYNDHKVASVEAKFEKKKKETQDKKAQRDAKKSVADAASSKNAKKDVKDEKKDANVEKKEEIKEQEKILTGKKTSM